MRLKGKICIVIGAGQTPGASVGNGRAAAITFAREGAEVFCVDKDEASAADTARMIEASGARAHVVRADVSVEADLQACIDSVRASRGRIDTLHYNVGVSATAGDASPLEITEAGFDTVTRINLRGFVLACKHVIPIMRAQREGCILAVGSIAAITPNHSMVAYKSSKAGMTAFTQQIAMLYAEFGIRANVILPGLMDTPMAIDSRLGSSSRTREQIVAARNARVPLRRTMGTAWDVANAALFLASDEARFITGVALPVDGGALLQS